MSVDPELLDDSAALEARDPHNVLRSLAGAGASVRQALEVTGEALPTRWSADDRPRAVLVAARGGAAVVADAIAAIVGSEGPVPVIALTGNRLPAWVGALDLVICLSLSGRAEGAVAIAAEAGRRGATLVTIGSPGSPLADVAGRFRGAHIPLQQPSWHLDQLPTSRTALWAMLTPALVICDRLGLLPDGGLGCPQDLEGVATALDAEAEVCRVGLETFVNPAKNLALELADSFPVLLGDSPLSAVAARRGASVLARAARVPAVHGSLPDDAGDIVATFDGPFTRGSDADIFADPFVDGPSSAQLRLLLLDLEDGIGFDIVRRIADDSATRNTLVQAGLSHDDESSTAVGQSSVLQSSVLQRFARVVARLDYAATYLALASGYNPAVSPHVADLRDALRAQ